jgi:hypothetical protein
MATIITNTEINVLNTTLTTIGNLIVTANS